MRQECIEAVTLALGRTINAKEAQDIESRILDSMRQLAQQEPQMWRQLSQAERLGKAADLAKEGLLHEAAKTKQRVALTILAHDKVMNRYTALQSDGLGPYQAVARVLDDAGRYAKGVANEYFASLMDTMDAVSPKYLGMVENAEQAAALVREIFGQNTGNAHAAKAAKAWLDTAEAMRSRFNAAGGDVRKLDYAYLPQPHDDVRVLKAGEEQWIADILPRLERSRYTDEGGIRLNDTQMQAMLAGVWETITTGGLNKMEPGKSVGLASRANRGADSRTLHFKDADSYLAYVADYGRGGILSAMQGHVARLAKDIALVEEFGPNPNTQWRFLHQTAEKTGAKDLVGPFLVQTEHMWDVLRGHTGSVANVKMAEISQGVRNIEVFGKLGSAFLSSVTDLPTYFVTTGFNRLDHGQALRNLIGAFGKDNADYANRAGLVAESVISDMNRWAESNIGQGWTAKLANATMKASFLEAWTDAVRRGFSVTMMGALGKISRQDWAALDAGDRHRLQAKGVSEIDFKVWQLAKPENWRGSQMLTVQSLRAVTEADLAAAGLTIRDQHRAVSKLLGAIVDESEYASLAQDLQTRAAVTRGTQKGEVNGELLRSLALFKGFPMAMLSRHWGRVAEQWRVDEKASAAAYAGALSVGLTIFGGLALDLKDLRDGKDPRDMSDPKFWAVAFAQGGGLGVFGDILYTGLSGENRGGQPNWTGLLGPVFGDGVDLANLTVGNAGQAMQGKDTYAGAEALRFAKGHLPFVNLWYAKAAIDHAGLQDMQELLSPGYLSRMQSRAQKEWGQGFWWQPGEGLPSRAPDLTQAIGE